VKRHDVYEALAGAIALGEADANERALFSAHAADCAACAAFAPREGELHELIARASAAENWRPDVAGTTLQRARERRSKRMRFTFGALSYAVALSLVINIALASGTGSWLWNALSPDVEAPANVASQPIELEPRPAPEAPARVTKPLHRHPAATPRKHRSQAVAAAPAGPREAPAGVPDLLAGLGLDGHSPARSVAFGPPVTPTDQQP
jgi:hypothetical protein